MATKIPWTEVTINPWVGCTKIAEGCKNCYAEQMARRLRGMGHKAYADVIGPHGQWTGRIGYQWDQLDKLQRMRKPRMVFLFSMSDPFHEDVPFEQMDKVMATITVCHQHIIQILTKRPERMAEYFVRPNYWTEILPNAISVGKLLHKSIQEPLPGYISFHATGQEIRGPLPNLWLGTSVSNQAEADKNIPILLQIPAAVHFVSVEPMLGPTDILKYLWLRQKCVGKKGCGFTGASYEFYNPKKEGAYKCPQCGKNHTYLVTDSLDQVIVGCESGPKRRPCELEWVKDIIEQCDAADGPVFVKQLEINGKVSHEIKEWHEWAQRQEYPDRGI